MKSTVMPLAAVINDVRRIQGHRVVAPTAAQVRVVAYGLADV